MIFARLLVMSLISVLTLATAGARAATDADWKSFQDHPARDMNTIPAKYDQSGHRTKASLFSARDIVTNRYLKIKMNERRQLSRPARPALRILEELPDIRAKLFSFLDLNELKSKGLKPLFKLSQVDQAKFRTAALDVQPWSGDYWPIYRGGLAQRYAMASDENNHGDWQMSYKLFQSQGNLADIVKRGDKDEIDSLSPAEKYDLLIGNPHSQNGAAYGFLTPYMWQEGKNYQNRNGRVEGWMGFCHGWAPASINEPRPVRVIEAQTALADQSIHFYPSDLKGLGTLAWAQNDSSTHLVGGRCGEKNPRKDPETGRLLDEDCFDVNPGLWHLAIINQIGLAKRGFVIDATYDYEVWNQPVFSYQISYFNPETGESAETADKARISKDDFTKDKFAKFRGGRVDSFVGVKMTIRYTAETGANRAITDSPRNDRTVSATYMYDLELNANDEIIGGEWYQNTHPDFLWLTEAGARPLAQGESSFDEGAWQPNRPIPDFWKDIAVQTAASSGAPLANIVEPLMKSAAK